tara:strand:+ start:23545 stop:24900 length:1356 start_codon:yes stop_codon:yes gene_type:complete
MDYNNNDIIIARSTPIGSSALALIRVSGEDLSELLNRIYPLKEINPNYVYRFPFKSFDTKEETIDTCMFVFFKGPKSFNGEDIIELTCHGSDYIVEQIINQFLSIGVRIAWPGEFSYRAFINNKIDLLQAESINAKIQANSELYGVALQNIEEGYLSKAIKGLRNSAINVMTIIEHELDFNEEEITHLSINKIKETFDKINSDLVGFLSSSKKMKKINDGYKVVIVGYPNVGKSSLFNRLIGADKAIVTSIEGTTRDLIEANVRIKGIPFTFVDTAGYRSTKDKIEILGIKKSVQIIKDADIVLALDDKNPRKTLRVLEEKIGLLSNKQIILVQTKSDVLEAEGKTKHIRVSSLNGYGINNLLTHLLTIVSEKNLKNSFTNQSLCTERQIYLVERAISCITEISDSLNSGVTMDIVSMSTRELVEILNEMIGKVYTEDVLNNIFKGFCVGK